ncbi:MAG: hypothetical protein GY851_22135, partial [bacterium]|nr:hypothetical protein [bacterium]
ELTLRRERALGVARALVALRDEDALDVRAGVLLPGSEADVVRLGELGLTEDLAGTAAQLSVIARMEAQGPEAMGTFLTDAVNDKDTPWRPSAVQILVLVGWEDILVDWSGEEPGPVRFVTVGGAAPAAWTRTAKRLARSSGGAVLRADKPEALMHEVKATFAQMVRAQTSTQWRATNPPKLLYFTIASQLVIILVANLVLLIRAGQWRARATDGDPVVPA